MDIEAENKSLIFNVLIKEEEDCYMAHCLELDIVATAKSQEAVQSDVIDLIRAQVGYAFSNNNLDYLYHPAPSEVWKEFFECKKSWEEKVKTTTNRSIESGKSFVPPWIIAKMCQPLGCHA